MRTSFGGALAVVATLAFAVPAGAQDWTQADEDRATILRFLEREEVSATAEGMGADMQDVGRNVLRMNADEAARVASQVRETEQAMAADTISVTTTTLILILVILILLILIL